MNVLDAGGARRSCCDTANENQFFLFPFYMEDASVISSGYTTFVIVYQKILCRLINSRTYENHEYITPEINKKRKLFQCEY